MRGGGLYCVFQPLGDLREGSIFAHEALIRGPEGSALHTPDVLLDLARREGLLLDFELVCVFTALRDWGDHGAPGRLFVNISADALVHAVALCGERRLGETVRAFGVSARMLVFRDHRARARDRHARAARGHPRGACLRRALALDDFGDGRSSLRLWSEVKPDFVKIDRYFIHDISEHPENLQMLQAIKGIADVFGTTLIAEGIETRDDLRALRDLAIPYGQGWVLGRPARTPREAIDGPALDVLQDRRVAVLPHLGQTARPGILRSLMVVQAPTVTPATSNDEVAAPAAGAGGPACAGRGGRHAPRGADQPPAVHEPLRHAVLSRSARPQALHRRLPTTRRAWWSSTATWTSWWASSPRRTSAT